MPLPLIGVAALRAAWHAGRSKPVFRALKKALQYSWSKKYPEVYNKAKKQLETLYGYKSGVNPVGSKLPGREWIKEPGKFGKRLVPKGTIGSSKFYKNPQTYTIAGVTEGLRQLGSASLGSDSGPPTIVQRQMKTATGLPSQMFVVPDPPSRKKKVPAQAKPAQAKSPYFLADRPWSKPVKLNVGAPGYHQWRKSDPVAREFRAAYAYHKKKGAKTFTWRVTNKKYKIP